MKNMENNAGLNNNVTRYKIETEKNNNIYVEEINKSEIDSIWKTLSEIQMIF